MRQKHEQQQAEERRAECERRIQALPSALRHILGSSQVRGKEWQTYIQRHFLPIQVVKRASLGELTEEDRVDELWMLN